MKVGKDYVQSYRTELYNKNVAYFLEQDRIKAVKKAEKKLLKLCDKHARMPLSGAKILLGLYIDAKNV